MDLSRTQLCPPPPPPPPPVLLCTWHFTWVLGSTLRSSCGAISAGPATALSIPVLRLWVGESESDQVWSRTFPPSHNAASCSTLNILSWSLRFPQYQVISIDSDVEKDHSKVSCVFLTQPVSCSRFQDGIFEPHHFQVKTALTEQPMTEA